MDSAADRVRRCVVLMHYATDVEPRVLRPARARLQGLLRNYRDDHTGTPPTYTNTRSIFRWSAADAPRRYSCV